LTTHDVSVKKHVYFAAPLFTPFERELNVRLNTILERCYSTFLPQRDGTLLPGRLLSTPHFAELSRQVYESDIEAIAECDILFAVLDGRVVDEGVAFELGYAAALEKICIGFRTDSRVLLPGGHNPMIQNCLLHVLNSEEEVASWVLDQTHR
jgi:nucleoside 2-deoxyribosyltransferase